jgi:hypothetical protein
MRVNRLLVTRFRLLPTTRLDLSLSSFHFPTSSTFNHPVSSNSVTTERKDTDAEFNMEGFVKLPEFPPAENSDASRGGQASVTALKAELEACLKKIGCRDTIVDFAGISSAPNPCLNLNLIGGIGLPLSDNDARLIIIASRQAAFRQGDEEAWDTPSCNAFEIFCDDFTTRNPKWKAYVQRLATKVSAKLGIFGEVSAELDKLSLYEKGAFSSSSEE